MTVTAWLNEKYPTAPYLIFPEIHQSLSFQYDQGLDAGVKTAFTSGLHNLGLDLTELVRPADVPVVITVAQENGVPSFQFANSVKWLFPGNRSVDAMLWAAYSLASCNGWLTQNENLDLISVAYHVSSQKIAASIIYEIQNCLGIVPNIEKLIEGVTRDYSLKFIQEAPEFSLQIITESGMEYISSTNKLFKKPDATHLEDLAERLFGTGKNFREEIEEYCHFLENGSSKYKRALEKAIEECTDRLYALPMYRLLDSLENAKSVILEGYAYKEQIRAAESTMRGEYLVKKLKGDSVEQIFAETTEAYREAAKAKIFTQFLSDLVESLIKKVEHDTRDAIDKLKIAAVEVRQFSVLTPQNYGVNVKWDQDGSIDLERLRLQEASWDASSIHSAQVNTWVQEGFSNRAWFAGETVSEVARTGGSLYPVQTISGLDNQLLYGIFARERGQRNE